jgi:hypothetical protein
MRINGTCNFWCRSRYVNQVTFFRFQAGRRRYTVHFNSMVQVSDCTTFAILLSPIVP